MNVKKQRKKNVTRKIEGFGQLLQKLRAKPAYLTSLLTETGMREIIAKRDIIIPENDEIDIVFASPTISSHDFPTISGFHGLHFIAIEP